MRSRGAEGGVRPVHADDLGVVAFRGETGAAGLGRLRVAIRDYDFRPRFRERLRACKPDALAGTRDNRYPAAKFEFLQIHVVLFLFTGRPLAKITAIGLFGAALYCADIAENSAERDGTARRRSPPDNLTLLIEAVQASWIRQKPHTIAGFQAEFSIAAGRGHSEFTGFDIEERIGPAMPRHRHPPPPTFPPFP